MMIVKNYVAPSQIHGVGLFAGENIEKDQIIFVLTPGVDVVMTFEERDIWWRIVPLYECLFL